MPGNFDDFVQNAEGLLVFLILRNLPDSDFVFSGSSDPRLVLMEGDLIDGTTSFEFVLGFLEVGDVPNVDLLVLSSGDDQFSIRGNGNSVNVAFVCLECKSEGVVKIPDLEPSVPSNGNEVGLDTLVDGGESDHTDPVGVIVLFGGELKISEGVEESQFSVGT